MRHTNGLDSKVWLQNTSFKQLLLLCVRFFVRSNSDMSETESVLNRTYKLYHKMYKMPRKTRIQILFYMDAYFTRQYNAILYTLSALVRNTREWCSHGKIIIKYLLNNGMDKLSTLSRIEICINRPLI